LPRPLLPLLSRVPFHLRTVLFPRPHFFFLSSFLSFFLSFFLPALASVLKRKGFSGFYMMSSWVWGQRRKNGTGQSGNPSNLDNLASENPSRQPPTDAAPRRGWSWAFCCSRLKKKSKNLMRKADFPGAFFPVAP
jgi:hypothetical protein